jgi:hypothetical protein
MCLLMKSVVVSHSSSKLVNLFSISKVFALQWMLKCLSPHLESFEIRQFSSIIPCTCIPSFCECPVSLYWSVLWLIFLFDVPSVLMCVASALYNLFSSIAPALVVCSIAFPCRLSSENIRPSKFYFRFQLLHQSFFILLFQFLHQT